MSQMLKHLLAILLVLSIVLINCLIVSTTTFIGSGFIGLLLTSCALQSIFLIVKEWRKDAYFNKLYSTAIENSDLGLAIVDKHHKFEYMNTTYKQLFNIRVQNPLGETSYAILPKEISDVLPANTFAGNQKNIVLSYTYEGELRYINYTCFAVFDAHDEPRFVSLIQDCTESEKKDIALKEQQKEIEYFANAKSSFIANISHEIKTPMNVIMGMTHILSQTSLTENQRDSLSKIYSSSELLLSIINDVLDISKIQKSNFILHPCDFYLTDMLKESEDAFLSDIQGKGLEYIKNFNFPPDLCLSLDKSRLIQVLLKLVNNACKFTSSGHIRLDISQIDKSMDSVLLEFAVEDTGLGIAEDDIPKVFQEFEQLENHLTKEHQGTGLGLTICKHVVTAMGGSISVESKKNVGSKFIFTVWAPVIDSAQSGHAVPLSSSIPRLKGEGRKILVVEDTELNYEVIENMLSYSNIICEHASDGQIAVDMCIKMPEDYYTAILMDIHMPNMDGYTAAEILKTEIGVLCPVIALTATNIDAGKREQYKDIMDDFVGKPFRYQDLYQALSPYFGSAYESDVTDTLNTEDSKQETSSALRMSLLEAAENLGCSEKQYIKHLTKFKTNYAHVDADIQELLADKNYIEAHRIAHSVKGLAGTLGLMALQQAAAELESALDNESKNVDAILPLFKTELADVCAPPTDHH